MKMQELNMWNAWKLKKKIAIEIISIDSYNDTSASFYGWRI